MKDWKPKAVIKLTEEKKFRNALLNRGTTPWMVTLPLSIHGEGAGGRGFESNKDRPNLLRSRCTCTAGNISVDTETSSL